jgi:MFS family permease
MVYGVGMDSTETPPEMERGFLSTAAVYAVTMAGGTLPIPLWHIWSVHLGFGPFVTTLTFAIYAVGTVISLTLFSKTSDQVGRRPVLLIGLGLAALSSALLLMAADITTIMAGRLLSGLGAGLVTATASATLSELAGPRRSRLAATTATIVNVGGLAAGIVAAAAVIQVGGEHTTTIRWLYIGYLATLAAVAAAVLLISETVAGASWARFRWSASRPALPAVRADRAAFTVAAMSVFVAFAVAGLFSSLVPTFLRDDVRLTAPLPSGLVVAALFAAALAAQLIASERAIESLWLATVALAGGTVLYEVGLIAERLTVFVAGTLAAGAGFGLMFRRGLHVTQRAAAPGRRADQIATYFLCAYAGNVIPTIALGALSEIAGDRIASVGLAIAITASAVATAGAAPRASGRRFLAHPARTPRQKAALESDCRR